MHSRHFVITFFVAYPSVQLPMEITCLGLKNWENDGVNTAKHLQAGNNPAVNGRLVVYFDRFRPLMFLLFHFVLVTGTKHAELDS